jgi:hypothetical protein
MSAEFVGWDEGTESQRFAKQLLGCASLNPAYVLRASFSLPSPPTDHDMQPPQPAHQEITAHRKYRAEDGNPNQQRHTE